MSKPLRRHSPAIAGLLIAGLLGHVVAAFLTDAGWIPYLHHIGGFFLIAVVTGLPIAALSRLFWRQQRERALLVFAAVQFVVGVLVMVGQIRAQ